MLHGPHSEGWQKHPELVDEVKLWEVAKSMEMGLDESFEDDLSLKPRPFEKTPEFQDREEDADE